MPSNAPVMRKAGPITSAGWPRLRPGATRAQTPGMAALDEQMLQARLEPSRPKRRSITAQRSSGAGLRGAAIFQLTGPGAQAGPDVEPAKSSESRRLVASSGARRRLDFPDSARHDDRFFGFIQSTGDDAELSLKSRKLC